MKPGAGKSQFIAQEIVNDLLHTSINIITNMPIKVQEICEYVAERSKKLTVAMLKLRLVKISREMEQQWREQKFHLADLIEHETLAPLINNSKIIIDEIANFCHAKEKDQVWIKRWEDLFGEGRHAGTEFWLITQHENKVHSTIKDHAGVFWRLSNLEDDRALFNITYGEFYSLAAAFSGKPYLSSTKICRNRRHGKKFIEEKTLYRRFNTDVFRLYDSHNAPIAGGNSGRRKHLHEEMTKWQLVRYMLKKHWKDITIRNRVVWLLLAICALPVVFYTFFRLVDYYKDAPAVEKEQTQELTQQQDQQAKPQFIQQAYKLKIEAIASHWIIIDGRMHYLGEDTPYGKLKKIDLLRCSCLIGDDTYWL